MNDFGQNFAYSKIYLGQSEGNIYTTEPLIEGKFEKWVNNNGEIVANPTNLRKDIYLKAETFVHFTWHKSEGMLIVTDIQGVDYCLTDPEIAPMDQYNVVTESIYRVELLRWGSCRKSD